MKHFIAALLTVLLLATTAPTFAQSALPTCHEDSALMWSMNTEDDMDRYFVYGSNTPITVETATHDMILQEVTHDTSQVEVDQEGKSVIRKQLMASLSEGPKYFRVSAVDKAGNESPLSDEVSCQYDKRPSTPQGVTIILQLTP